MVREPIWDWFWYQLSPGTWAVGWHIVGWIRRPVDVTGASGEAADG